MSPPNDSSETGARTLAWLVDRFVAEVPGVAHAAVVSTDGLLLTSSEGLSGELAEQLSAVASGILGLGASASHLLDLGSCRQTIVRMRNGYLFLMAVGDGSCLTVVAAADCEMRVVAYQMTLLVESSAHVLTPQLRKRLRARKGEVRVR